MSGQGGLDGRPLVAEESQQAQPQPGPGVFADGVVGVDHDVADAEGVEGGPQGAFLEAQKGAHESRPIAAALDGQGGPSTSSAADTGQVHQHALGDVAFVVGGDDGGGANVCGHLTQCGVAQASKGAFVAAGGMHRHDPARQPQRPRPGHHREGFVGAAWALLVVDDDDHGVDVGHAGGEGARPSL